MKIVCISDTHNQHWKVDLPSGDILIHGGDLTFNGTAEEIKNFNSWLEKQKEKFEQIIVIAGNHDFLFERSPEIAKKIITNACYLENSGLIYKNINIWGSPISPRFMDYAFNRERGKEIKKYWDMIPSNTDILVIHPPPFGILDKIYSGLSVGCEELLKAIYRVKPKLVVFGHIHESHGYIEKNGIKFVNASSLDLMYRFVNKPVTIDL
jgi:Icc-related predicted phosphoesterase